MVTFTSDVESRRRPGEAFTILVADVPTVVSIETIRPQKDRWVVHFAGVDDRSHAERLVNKALFAEPVERADTLWVHELIGSRVLEVSGVERGTCVGVVDNPAHDLLELADGALVPVTFVVSCVDGVTVIDPPEGLFDLAD